MSTNVTRKIIKCGLGVVVAGTVAVMSVDPHRHVTEETLLLIGECEQCRQDVYPDPATRSTPYTVGIGATRDLDDKPFKLGKTVTEDTVVALFARDVLKDEECIISKFNGEDTVYNANTNTWTYVMPQPVFDSLVSVVHTLGCNGLTINKTGKPTQILNAGKRHQWHAVCSHITDFIYANGTVNKGLQSRRNKEQALCNQWRYQ